jgi:hypothetical protein
MDKSWLGWAEIEPNGSFVAGSMVTWKFEYHVGKYGIDDGGSIRIARRSVSDMEAPQFNGPKKSGYTTIVSDRDVRLEYNYKSRGHIRPFRGAVQVDVRDGSLYEGDTITIIFGDKSHGSPGLRAQTFREKEHIFKTLVDPFGTGRFEEIIESPCIQVIGGPVERIEIAAPSGARKSEPFEVVIRAIDSYGNRSDNYRGIVDFEELHVESYTFTGKDKGAHRFRVNLDKLGLQTLRSFDDYGHIAESNPIMIFGEEPKHKLFWGDMHGQTKQTVGTGTVEEYFMFLRDVACLDFGGWQGNDFQITKPLWWEVKEKTRKYNEPGKLVLFLGYEWSGLTPAGGDHNIYFLGDEGDLHRSDHWLIEDRSDEESDRYPITKLWKEFEGRKDVMAVAHIGGRHANLDFWNPERVPLIEVHSHHGTFEWFLEEALRRECKVGFIATSDDHTCRPGFTLTTDFFTTKGGYTAVYAEKLTREALWEAFWARRVYGTTGERIILDFKVDGHMMGEEYNATALPKVSVEVHGTKKLHAVEIMNGSECIFRHPFSKPKQDNKLIKIEWMGARVKSRPKRVNWDGGLYIDKGSIEKYKEYAFDYLDQGVKQITNQRLEWTSTTGGDSDGVLLELNAHKEAEINFYSKPISFKFKPNEITNTPKVFEVGPLNQRVKIQAIIKEPLPKDLSFEFIVDNLHEGVNPLWVKVIQEDGSMAWGSPVYLNYSS